MAFNTLKPPCTKLEKKAGCIQTALDVLGDKWTPLLLGKLVSGEKTFGELELQLAGISPRTLSQRINKLEADGIVCKRQYNARPPRYKYVLTTKGAELQEVLQKMADWGERYHPSIPKNL
jgi:DNA-binding HxlR family transcriptional regulator